MRRAIILTALASAAACSQAAGPATLDTAHDTCASCRMVVSDRHLASQLVAPGEDARFFDDLRCLREYLSGHRSEAGAVFVADHRTGAWTPASAALYSRLAQPSTPMASGFIAHADAASRTADPAAATSQRVSLDEVFGDVASRMRP